LTKPIQKASKRPISPANAITNSKPPIEKRESEAPSCICRLKNARKQSKINPTIAKETIGLPWLSGGG